MKYSIWGLGGRAYTGAAEGQCLTIDPAVKTGAFDHKEQKKMIK